MSTWRWKYDPEKCDHGICVGDCDVCDREVDDDDSEMYTIERGEETMSNDSNLSCQAD